MSNVLKINNTKWRVNVIEDAETKELYIELPAEVLAQMGWDFGTELEWIEESNGAWLIKEQQQET
jgi:hypothetical protein